MQRRYWLMKSEPTEFSIDALAHRVRQTESWDGVRNYQARNFLRAMHTGDLALFYHSSCPHPAIVGVVNVTRTAYPDPSAFDPTNPYYDPASTPDRPRWFCVEVQLIKRFDPVLTLERLKRQPELSSMPLLRRGNRLSVMPITHQEWDLLMRLQATLTG